MSTPLKSAYSKSSVNLTPNQTYTALSTDSAVVGSFGGTVVLPDTAINVSLSGGIANLDLSKSIFNYYLMPNGLSGAYLFSSNGGLLASIAPSTSGMHVVFGDQSQLTLSVNSLGFEQIHYDKVQLTPNYVLSVPNSNITILGSSGTEVVKIAQGVNNVTLDSAVETVTLSSVNYDPSLVKSNGTTLSVLDTQGNALLNWSASSSSNKTLNFNNAMGSVKLNPLGQAQFVVQSLLLNSGQSYTLGSSDISIYGNVGSESVTLIAGARNESIDANVEKVFLPSPVSAYTWQTLSGNMYLYDASHTLVASIGVSRASVGTTLSFADQTLSAQLSSAGIGVHNASGQVVLSGGVVAGSPTSANSNPNTSSTSISSSALAPNGQSTGTTSLPSSTSNPNSTGSGPNSAAGSAHLQYNVDWTAFSSYSGSVVSSIQACLTKALNNIAADFNAKGTLDIKVVPENVNKSVLAEASGALVPVPANLSATAHTATQTTAFLVESQTGLDANGDASDATVYINMADLNQFNLSTTQSPASGQYDLTTILTHEMLHALGFDGLIGQSTSQRTVYDTYVSLQSGVPYFTGPHAQSVYGGPVPLAAASTGSGSAYYHVAVASDLMSDALRAGDVKTISKLDLAILQDLGAPVLVGIASQA